MKLKKKALLYDISNLAFLIADTHKEEDVALHRVRDICEDGNIDRVSRMLGLAYANVCDILNDVLEHPDIDINRDFTSTPHDYEFMFKDIELLRYRLTQEKKLKIKETIREYMISMVMSDWLEMTYPLAADIWKFRIAEAMEKLKETVVNLTSSGALTIRRRISPF